MRIPVLRKTHPRLFHPADDPEFRFAPPQDDERKRILKNIIAECKATADDKPWNRIPERFDSPHPYHQLNITLYTAMHACAMFEQNAFAWLITRNRQWRDQAKRWLPASTGWRHGNDIYESFYIANRYMVSYSTALDWLDGELTPSEETSVIDCLCSLMRRWWPQVNAQRHKPDGAHHPTVDNGHFGVAAIQLLGKVPEAEMWLSGVIDRFRGAIMPNGCGPDGEPMSGKWFWKSENQWVLHFCDALKNVTGIDLYKEFPDRMRLPLKWFRHHMTGLDYCIGMLDVHIWAHTLLRLAQDAGDAELRAVALADKNLGKFVSLNAAVKNCPAECMFALGTRAYLYCDPNFKPRRQRALPTSRRFMKSCYGTTALLRDRWEQPSLLACITGYVEHGSKAFSALDLHWGGRRILQTICCAESQPVDCGSVPSIGDQNEFAEYMGAMTTSKRFDMVRTQSMRLHREYWLLRGKTPVFLTALRRKPRGIKVVHEAGESFAQLNGKDYLQYPRDPWFNPNGGTLKMRVRLREEPSPERDNHEILFNAGMGIAGDIGPRVNVFTLGFIKGDGLTFNVSDQCMSVVSVRIDPKKATMKPGAWHDVEIAWGGFNNKNGKPFMEVAADDYRERFDDPAVFGSMGDMTVERDVPDERRPFVSKPNSQLAFGGAIQYPRFGAKCDISRIEMKCDRRRRFVRTFENGLEGETGSDPIAWKLHPVALKSLSKARAVFKAGSEPVDVLPAWPEKVTLEKTLVPYAPEGYQASSNRCLDPKEEDPLMRVIATAREDDVSVMAFAPGKARMKITRTSRRFTVHTASGRYVFSTHQTGRSILSLRTRGARARTGCKNWSPSGQGKC